MNKKPLNILLLHNKKDMYLSYTIKRLKKLHPSDNIYLLGTQYNNCYSGIAHHMIEDYMTSANTFQEVYLHIGTNFYDLELIYFQRWFILKDFCEAHAIDSMFHLESDVLCCKSLHVFDDMIANGYDIGGGKDVGNISYHPVYMRLSVLQNMCAYMLDQYKNPKHLLELFKGKMADQTRFKGSIVDMFLLGKFMKETKGLQVYNMHDIEKIIVLEGNLSISYNHFKSIEYVMVDGENNTRRKKVVFKNGSAYIERADTHELQEVQSLHLHGINKRLAPFFYGALTGKGVLYKRLRFLTGVIVRMLTIVWRISRKTTNTLQRIINSMRV